MQEKKLTGYPSIDKPWLKYYSEEAINAPLPECTLYEHILKCNNDNLNRIALNYYGTNTSYKSMFEEIDRIAGALAGIGVKQGDIVTVIMINSPETIFLMFALNKVGAVANIVWNGNIVRNLILTIALECAAALTGCQSDVTIVQSHICRQV